MQGRKTRRRCEDEEKREVKINTRKVKSNGNEDGKQRGDRGSATPRRLKGKNELSGICHDFTRLCTDKVMNVNDV